jgi:hypothetical protein
VLADFYSAVAQASFTLLGLWWVAVLRAWPEHWVEDPARRRTGYHLSLYFMLPGMMSALSLLSNDSPVFWRTGFAAACAVGAAEAVLLGRGAATAPSSRWLLYASFVLYLAGGVVAAVPDVVSFAGDDVTPLHVEGVLVTLILFMGMNLAWIHLVRRD